MATNMTCRVPYLPMTSFVAGLVNSIQLVVVESTYCPSMKSFVEGTEVLYLCRRSR